MNEVIVTIREANSDDLPAILALYSQPDYDDGNVLGVAEAMPIFKRMADYPFYKFFVYESDQAIKGVYALLIMENLGHLGSKSAVVEGVAVDPADQSAGIGRKMMQHALEMAGSHGCYKLALSSNLKRERAHAFYERLGFQRHGFSFVAEPAAGNIGTVP